MEKERIDVNEKNNEICSHWQDQGGKFVWKIPFDSRRAYTHAHTPITQTNVN